MEVLPGVTGYSSSLPQVYDSVMEAPNRSLTERLHK